MTRTCLKAPFHIDHYEKPFENTIQSQSFFAPKIYTNNKVYVTDW